MNIRCFWILKSLRRTIHDFWNPQGPSHHVYYPMIEPTQNSLNHNNLTIIIITDYMVLVKDCFWLLFVMDWLWYALHNVENLFHVVMTVVAGWFRLVCLTKFKSIWYKCHVCYINATIHLMFSKNLQHVYFN